MKSLLETLGAGILVGLYFIIKVAFPVTAVITHFWTAYIGFAEGGFFGGILTLFLPVLSQFYWIYAMSGVNDFYFWVALIHIILAFPAMLMSGNGLK